MTTNPKPSAEALRRAEIKRRRETSAFWMAVHILGSLNLAVILLITIAGAIGFATFMESRFDSDVARYYIYKATWFDVWLLALALNLLCAALTRWPWQRKHLGFVITHAGIILMLIGAVLGRTGGVEAFVSLDKTKPPESRLFTKEMLLTIDAPNGMRGQLPFETKMQPPTEVKPFEMPLEGSDVKLVIDRVTENLVPDDTLTASTDTGAPAGIGLHFINAGMGQNVPAVLMSTPDASTFDFFGMAQVLLVDSLDETHLIAPEKAVVPATPAAPVRSDAPFRETQLVFLNAPPVVDTDSDIASGYSVKLASVEGKSGEFTVTVTALNGTSKTWPLHEIERKWQNLAGDGDPIMFRVAKIWPDFAMKDGAPVSLSDVPKNPAVLMQITGPTKLLPPPAPKAAAAPAPPMPKGLIMRVALAKEPGKIVYETEREGKIDQRGLAAQGDVIHLGWSKWEAKVDQALAHAEMLRDVKEFEGTPSPMMADTLRPGIRAHLVGADGKSGPVVWIPAGTSRELFSSSDLHSEMARVGYGQRVIPLPFSITLENFEVPRDEGTETPADYISSLRFDEAATGRVVHDKAHMNSPAMFPGDYWRSFLGWNYKFSQANWNPNDLNQTTLQVLYDPGWPFKWIGSLGICLGITLMFYFMPKRSASERGGREETEELATKEHKELKEK
jgi:hypothetical protein